VSKTNIETLYLKTPKKETRNSCHEKKFGEVKNIKKERVRNSKLKITLNIFTM